MSRYWWLRWAAVVAACGCGEGALTFPQLGDERVLSDHREVDIRFESGEAILAGTLYLPLGTGPFPVAAATLGSSWTLRATFEEVQPFVNGLGVGAFSYDRRGEGSSEGDCCPADPARFFELLADDLVAAVDAVHASPFVDGGAVGVFGSSQGGWVAPLAANLAPTEIAYVIVTVGGAVSTGQEALYDRLTGYDVCERTAQSMSDIMAELRAAGPSGFDPRPSLERMTQPAIWIYGENDFSQPTALAVENLEAIEASTPKPWAIVVLPNANHDLIDNGSICQTDGPLADVLTPLSAWIDEVLGM